MTKNLPHIEVSERWIEAVHLEFGIVCTFPQTIIVSTMLTEVDAGTVRKVSETQLPAAAVHPSRARPVTRAPSHVCLLCQSRHSKTQADGFLSGEREARGREDRFRDEMKPHRKSGRENQWGQFCQRFPGDILCGSLTLRCLLKMPPYLLATKFRPIWLFWGMPLTGVTSEFLAR